MKTKLIKDAKNKKMLICMFIFFGIFVFIQNAFAATYYVDGLASDDTGDGTTMISAKKYVQSGLFLLKSGDTLIIADGIYTGANNMITSGIIPSGTEESYTIIKAENDFGVTIDGQATFRPCQLASGSQYIELYGILFCNSINTTVSISGNHIKLFRCGAADPGGGGYPFYASGSSYVLFEECYAYGLWSDYDDIGGRYKFAAYQADHTIFRRCVCRQDGWVWGQGACFTNYSSIYTEYQNNIAIDVDEPRHWHPNIAGDMWGGFNINGLSNYVYYRGNIAANITASKGISCGYEAGGYLDNLSGRSWRIGGSEVDPVYEMINNLVLGNGTGIVSYHDFPVTNSTFVNIYDDPLCASSEDGNASVSYDNGIITTKNSLFVNIVNVAAQSFHANSDYNAYYNNGINYAGTIARPNDKSVEAGTEINVLWSELNPMGALKYPVRIEPNSNLENQGENGTNIGASIVKRYGVSGTLYGEPGYNTLTNEDLWPFPNEDKIKEKMRAYNKWDPYDNIDPNNPSNPETYVKGDRGFCADGKQLNGIDDITLTSYIWEYLGNPIPPEIYGSSGITGDINSDGKVDITDIQACVNHILGTQDWGAKADVNSDGSVNVIDVQEIVNVILGN